ncbi:MAG: hypothetical protein HFE86_03650 [Clostridiales bacterium]|nr:hypothetical protein [Clostridiales bacterium]
MSQQKETCPAMRGDCTWEYTVASYDVAPNRSLRLSAQLKLQQEVGEKHLEQAGFPYTYLYDELGLVFVLTRAASRIYRAPVFEEPVTVTTWCKGLQGIQYLRCYRFCDMQGNLLIDSATTFALINARDHQLVRPSTVKEFERFVHLPDRENTCKKPGRILLPPDLEKADDRRLYHSDMDYNGHLNNTVYGDFITDYLPAGLADKVPSSFQIHFAAEAGLGETLAIYTARQGDTAYCKGEHARGLCFEASCTFGEDQ